MHDSVASLRLSGLPVVQFLLACQFASLPVAQFAGFSLPGQLGSGFAGWHVGALVCWLPTSPVNFFHRTILPTPLECFFNDDDDESIDYSFSTIHLLGKIPRTFIASTAYTCTSIVILLYFNINIIVYPGIIYALANKKIDILNITRHTIKQHIRI